MPLLRQWFIQALGDKLQHRDIGKVLAYATEIYTNNFIQENTSKNIQPVYGEAYDGITYDTKTPVRHQVKFRSSAWHLETTRRNSAKNINTSSTGHVAYSEGEFDLLAIFIPGVNFSLKTSKVRCIPASALCHPTKPGQLLTSADCLKSIYNSSEKTLEVLKKVYM
jgi:hypothetical protein